MVTSVGRKGDSRYEAVLRGDPCSYCGRTEAWLQERVADEIVMHVDHIVARRRGGPDAWSNQTAACSHCNSRKRDSSLLGFLLWQGDYRRRDYAERVLEIQRDYRAIGRRA